MKRLFFATLTVIFLFSCSPKIIPLKGTYPPPPIEISSTKSFDEVWDKLIDLFAQKGLSIRIIDRSSGLIISSKSALLYTIENKNGSLKDPTAYIVVPKYYNAGVKKYYPVTMLGIGKEYPVIGDWNVRIKKSSNGTIINVNIVNVEVDMPMSYKIKKPIEAVKYKTTGVFENLIADIIK